MSVKYKNTSSYRNTKMNNTYLDIYNPAIIPDFTKTRDYVIAAKYNKRPDLLAYELYGKSELWWVFALYNRDILLNPLYDFVTGLTIQIPKSVTDIGF